MSHFTCLVIGENPEEQLAPFNEAIEVEEYVREDISQEEQERFKEFYLKKNPELSNLSFEELYSKFGEDWNGNNWKLIDNKWVEVSTYNPKSKWDWYLLGGRWVGTFKLKKGASGNKGEASLLMKAEGYEEEKLAVDQARKKDIDFKAMSNDPEKIKNLGEQWDKVMSGKWIYKPEYYLEKYKTKENYIEIESKFGCFSVLKDGEWFQKGDMGWWGMVKDEKNPKEWQEEFNKLIEGLPEDTLLSIYDLHI